MLQTERKKTDTHIIWKLRTKIQRKIKRRDLMIITRMQKRQHYNLKNFAFPYNHKNGNNCMHTTWIETSEYEMFICLLCPWQCLKRQLEIRKQTNHMIFRQKFHLCPGLLSKLMHDCAKKKSRKKQTLEQNGFTFLWEWHNFLVH